MLINSCQVTGRSFLVSDAVLLTSQQIERMLTRIGHEIIEGNKLLKYVILAGMRTRGIPLAYRIANVIEQLNGSTISVIELDFHRYRDDIENSETLPPQINNRTLIDITGKTVVLVDDVLYTGRSIRAAMDALIQFGRPKRIQLAVLVDRGHRELPIKADYVGKNIPSSIDDRIQVRLSEIDGDNVVVITKNKAQQQ
jgi:pyrimidine operon attenuation protein/uracil phosphoribosyltransferase